MYVVFGAGYLLNFTIRQFHIISCYYIIFFVCPIASNRKKACVYVRKKEEEEHSILNFKIDYYMNIRGKLPMDLMCFVFHPFNL